MTSSFIEKLIVTDELSQNDLVIGVVSALRLVAAQAE